MSLGSFNTIGSPDDQAATFMHELGHTLNLGHGGDEVINSKPNYLSIMSYSRQLNRHIRDRPIDYSREVLPTLNENNLDENVGIQGSNGFTVYSSTYNSLGLTCPISICGLHPIIVPARGPINWNNRNDIEPSVAMDINKVDDDSSGQILHGYNDWENLRYNFRLNAETYADGVHLDVVDNELTSEQANLMEQQLAPLYDVTFLPPITIKPYDLKSGRTLPIKFTARNNTTNEFIYDDTVNVNVIDSKEQLITHFTYGIGSNNVRIDSTEKQYIVNFNTKNYNLKIGETYTIIVTFGKPIDGLLKGYAIMCFILTK